jgi:2-(1,2-epoxy-1,2-dihydrophenyl)acetyl-CoA isomerase
VTISLARPARANAVTITMVTELHRELERLAADDSVRIVVLTGAGSWFSPGGDVEAFANGEFRAEVEAGYDPARWHIPVLLHEMPQVTIAALNGPCAGAALGWACACDLRMASDAATFATAFLRVGLAGDMALPWSLGRVVGAGAARWLSFAGERIDAAEAHRLGLVSRVYARAEFPGRIDELVGRLCAAEPAVLAELKRRYLAAEHMSLAQFSDLEVSQMDLNALVRQFDSEVTEQERAGR